MADAVNALSNPIASMYPQPPKQETNALAGNPLALIPAIAQINQLRSKQAIGNAYQGAIGADGSFNPDKAMADIKSNPAAAWGVPEAVGSVTDLRNKMIANSTATFGLAASQNQEAQRLIAGLAQDPNLTYDKVLSVMPSLVRAGIPPAMISGYIGGLPSDPKALRSYIGNLANTTMGAATAAGRVTGPVSPDGAPSSVSLGQTVHMAPVPGAPGARGAPAVPAQPGIQTGLSPIAQADQAEYLGDQTKSAATLANVRPLQQAFPLIQQLSNSNFGPGSPELAKIKGALTTAGIIDPNTSDLQVRQEVGKYLLRYASGAQQAGRSDNALSAALGSNPNLDLTQPANLSLIRNQIGMDRMDAAIPHAAGKFDGYKNYKSGFYQSVDPRAFTMDMMKPEEIADLQKTLKGDARAKFNRSLKIAVDSGMITPPARP